MGGSIPINHLNHYLCQHLEQHLNVWSFRWLLVELFHSKRVGELELLRNQTELLREVCMLLTISCSIQNTWLTTWECCWMFPRNDNVKRWTRWRGIFQLSWYVESTHMTGSHNFMSTQHTWQAPIISCLLKSNKVPSSCV